jgi:WD40 repeat protein
MKKEEEKIKKSKNDLSFFKVTAFKDILNEINDSLNQLKNVHSSLERKILNNTEINFIESNAHLDEKIFGELEITRNLDPSQIKWSLRGHTDPITSLVVLENGLLASGSNTIAIWNIEKGIVKKTFKIFSWSLAVLRNGHLVNGYMGGKIQIWDIQKEKIQKTLIGHNEIDVNIVLSLAVLLNGDLASGADDKTIIIWNIEEGREKRKLRGHSGPVKSLAVLENGDLASGSNDEKIIIWNVEKGEMKKTLKAQGHCVWSLAVFRNGHLASGMDEKIGIWDVEKGELKRILIGHSSCVLSLAIMPNGELASGSYDNRIIIWNVEKEEVKRILELEDNQCGDPAREGAFSLSALSNGNLAIGSGSGEIKIWNCYQNI